MRFDFDVEADALYIRIRDGIVDRTLSIESGTLADVDVRGDLLGIEVIRPARPVAVDEITSRFELGPSDVRILEDMWGGGDRRYPFETEAAAAAAG